MMTPNDAKNEMLVMVLADLAEICKKLNENLAVPEALRLQAHKFVSEFNSLVPHHYKGTPVHHAQGEELLIRMARFLPRVLEVQAEPRVVVA